MREAIYDIDRQVRYGIYPVLINKSADPKYKFMLSLQSAHRPVVAPDKHSIARADGQHICFLPNPSDVCCHTVYRELVAIGYTSGQVVVIDTYIDMKMACGW